MQGIRITGLVVVALCTVGPAFADGCHSSKAVCRYVDVCINRKVFEPSDPDVKRIREGVASNDGVKVWEGLTGCAIDMKREKDFSAVSAGCSNQQYVDLARSYLQSGKNACSAYAN